MSQNDDDFVEYCIERILLVQLGLINFIILCIIFFFFNNAITCRLTTNVV